MTTKQFAALFARLGWTQTRLAAAMGIAQPRVSEFRLGRRRVPEPQARLLEYIVDKEMARRAPTGGTFTLTYGGKTTAPIPFDAAPGEIRGALKTIRPTEPQGPDKRNVIFRTPVQRRERMRKGTQRT